MKQILILALILAACGIVGAAVVFEDNFDSQDNWVKLHGTVSATASNGLLSVENTGDSWAFFKHDANFSTFTYSVKLRALTEHTALGIAFCWQASTFEGYIFTLWNDDQVTQYYSLLKMVRQPDGSSATYPLHNGWHSFINLRSNEITVSKTGNRIDLFCNGVWIDSLSDPTFASGGIGLVVGDGETAAFDNARVTDVYETGVPPQYFVDNFDDGGMGGWRVFGNDTRTIRATGGALSVAAGTGTQNTIILSDGFYRSVPVRATVTRTGTDLEASYGLMLLRTVFERDSTPAFTWYDAFVFKINGNRNYSAYYLNTTDSTKFNVFPPNTAIHGTTDTLLITSDYQFVVNGTTLPDIDFDTLNFDFNAVGFAVDQEAVVQFDNFAAGDSSKPQTPVIRPEKQLAFPGRPFFELGGAGIIYDVRGRVVARYNGTLRDSLRELGPGQFFIVPQDGRNYRARRAILNMR